MGSYSWSLKHIRHIEKTSTKFKVPENVILQPGKRLDVEQVHGIQDFERVTVAIDATDSIKLTLWEQDIDKLDVSKSYQLNNIVVRTYV